MPWNVPTRRTIIGGGWLEMAKVAGYELQRKKAHGKFPEALNVGSGALNADKKASQKGTGWS